MLTLMTPRTLQQAVAYIEQPFLQYVFSLFALSLNAVLSQEVFYNVQSVQFDILRGAVGIFKKRV